MSLTIDLTPDSHERLRKTASLHGESPEEHARGILERALISSTADSILAIFEDAWHEVPLDQWQRLPTDLSENIDHYLYGAPKVKP